MKGGMEEVGRRVRQLDDAALPRANTAIDRLAQVIDCMAEVTNGYIGAVYGGLAPIVAPCAADAVVAGSSLLGRLSETSPGIVGGPLRLAAQAWTVAASTSFSVRHRELSPATFLSMDEAIADARATKPARGGLFSSTVISPTKTTSWDLYLSSWGGTLFPPPRHTYRILLAEEVRVFEVNSAEDWARLVERNPIVFDGILYPNWPHIAGQYDGIHMTTAAIVAMQGLRLKSTTGVIAETYWDVESTLWLNWCIRSSSLLETIYD